MKQPRILHISNMFPLLALLLMLVGQFAYGQGLSLGVPRPVTTPVTAKAAISADPLTPGTSAQIVVELSINSRYHIQSAFAPKPYIPALLTPSPSAGITFEPVQYQKAKEIATPPALGTGTLSVYEGKTYIMVPLNVAPDAPPGEHDIELSLTTQACDDNTCDPPKTTTLKIPIKIAHPGDVVPTTKPSSDIFAAAAKVEFAIPTSRPATTASGLASATQDSPTVPLLSAKDQLQQIENRPYTPFNTEEEHHSLAAIFLFALVGGLVLNIMPCVLPVIPLKALSFIQQAHGNPRLAMLHGLAFSAGVVSLFVLLAQVLRGFGLFYGQQFQSPFFLITMTLFVVALALSMLGVWTISPPRAVYEVDAKYSHRSGFLGSYSSGLMATLLATPCSAPFLGPVFAWALTQPAWLTSVALAVVGIGMSLPYLFLAKFPTLLNRVPRAGRWSELLKQGLGIVMLGVAIYLITRIPNTRVWTYALMGTLVMGLVCWGWGQIPSVIMTQQKIWTIRAVVISLGIALGGGIFLLAQNTASSDTARWLPFNVALLDQALEQGRPVVIDWTADWCINCQVLDATVLSRAQTQQAFTENHALLLRADLTVDNPEATALNRKLGGEAIPVLAIFSPSRPNQPVVLRDTYSVARVVHELQTAR